MKMKSQIMLRKKKKTKSARRCRLKGLDYFDNIGILFIIKRYALQYLLLVS
jgi:hypothetical protein